MEDTILNYKTKLLILCLSASLAACGGDIANPESQHKSVSISATSIIPTSLGISGGGHALKVDNHTGKNLTLSSFYLSGAKENHDSRINLAGCKTLAKDSSCVLIFSPDEADGSAVLKLDFVDENGERYSAAQLVEYSSQVVESNGFYVSNANLDSLTATAAYSVAIPFVADDDYSSISIDSSVKALSQSVDCANGTSKGNHCTALLTLPAADQNSGSYPNTITIKGVKADGSVNTASIASRVSYSDVAHLAISNGPLLIQANSPTSGHPSLSQQIMIVNNGDRTATNIAASSLVGASWSDGITTPSGASLLTKTINCNGTTQATLPTQLEKGKFCEVTFTLTKPNATGSEDYSVSYFGGINGTTKLTTATTKVYFRGLSVDGSVTVSPDSAAEIAMGDSFNFTATLRGTGNTTISAVFANPMDGIVTPLDSALCNLSSSAGKTSCRFKAIVTAYSTWNTTLPTGQNMTYQIVVTSNGMPLADSPITFGLFTPTVYLPATGQTKTAPLKATEGMDGFYATGVKVRGKFKVGTGLEDRCVTDNQTGLMWSRDVHLFGGNKNWSDALDAVAKMNTTPGATGYNLCGYKDWHLPTLNELLTLINYVTGSQFSLLSGSFINLPSLSSGVFNYWSSTSSIDNNAWFAYFLPGGGRFGIGPKSNNVLVWPVRLTATTGTNYPAQVAVTGETDGVAGSDSGVAWPNPRFLQGRSVTANCMTDKLTGLMWVRDSKSVIIKDVANGSATNWQNALDSVKQANSNGGYCGYTDWRLPNITELKSLINYGQANPANWLNNQGFSSVNGDRYWSSSTSASDTTNAWYVNFNRGNVGAGNKTDDNYVWPVRGGK